MHELSNYRDLSHEEVLLLQDNLAKIPSVFDYLLWTSVFALVCALLYLYFDETSYYLALCLILLIYSLYGLQIAWHDQIKKRQLKLDIIHRQKRGRTARVESKNRALKNGDFNIFIEGTKEPLVIDEPLFKSVKYKSEIIIWESRYAKVQLALEIKSFKVPS